MGGDDVVVVALVDFVVFVVAGPFVVVVPFVVVLVVVVTGALEQAH